jgi:hypothetical protein
MRNKDGMVCNLVGPYVFPQFREDDPNEEKKTMKIGEHIVYPVSKDSVKVGCQLVTREDVKAVLTLMDDYKDYPTIHDYVKVAKVKDTLTYLIGRFGKVAAVHSTPRYPGLTHFVEFAEPGSGLHNGDGIINRAHGYWFSPDCLQRVE